jgi:hypothetical protein
MWDGIVRDGIATGMRFVANVYGFDVYTSNYLKNTVADSALLEKDGATGTRLLKHTTVLLTSSSLQMQVLTRSLVHGVRLPEVDYEYNKDKQRHEYVTTARYGVKKYRPEGIVFTVVSNPAV